MNICSDVAECGPGNAGCELEGGHALSPVGVEKTLQYSTDGLLKLTYKGPLDNPTGTAGPKKKISFLFKNEPWCVYFHPCAEPRVLICMFDTNLVNLNNCKIIINHQENKNIVGCIFGSLPSLV